MSHEVINVIVLVSAFSALAIILLWLRFGLPRAIASLMRSGKEYAPPELRLLAVKLRDDSLIVNLYNPSRTSAHVYALTLTDKTTQGFVVEQIPKELPSGISTDFRIPIRKGTELPTLSSLRVFYLGESGYRITTLGIGPLG